MGPGRKPRRPVFSQRGSTDLEPDMYAILSIGQNTLCSFKYFEQCIITIHHLAEYFTHCKSANSGGKYAYGFVVVVVCNYLFIILISYMLSDGL